MKAVMRTIACAGAGPLNLEKNPVCTYAPGSIRGMSKLGGATSP